MSHQTRVCCLRIFLLVAPDIPIVRKCRRKVSWCMI